MRTMGGKPQKNQPEATGSRKEAAYGIRTGNARGSANKERRRITIDEVSRET